MKHTLFFLLLVCSYFLYGCNQIQSIFDKDEDEESTPEVVTSYTIDYSAPQHGLLSVSKSVNVSAGTTITLTVSANVGYQLSSITVFNTTTATTIATTQSSQDETVYTFTMPESNVTITVLFESAPTYTVTYADGVDSEEISVPSDTNTYWEGKTVYVRFAGLGSRSGYTFTGWTAEENGTTAMYTQSGTNSFTMGSTNVTLTAVWTAGDGITYIGTKAPTEEKAVGDIIFSDGSAVPYTDSLVLTDTQKAAAIAVVFYTGSDSDILGKKSLAVGLQNTTAAETTSEQTRQWAPKDTTGYKRNFSAIQSTRKTASSTGTATGYTYTEGGTTYYFTGDFDGSDNWNAICERDPTGTAEKKEKQQYPAYYTCYPAYYWIKTYAENNGLSNTAYASGWYLPTAVELHILYSTLSTINAAIACTNGTALSTAHYYWTSSQHETTSYYAWRLRFETGSFNYNGGKDNAGAVCAIRALY